MSSQQKSTEVLVVGAGLAGLTAAVKLQQAGRQVLLVERRPFAGGLCGNWELDGYEFIRACNEFGGQLAATLESLQVPVKFVRSQSRVHLGSSTLSLPPTPGTVLKLLPRVPGLMRMMLAARHRDYGTLGELLDASGVGESTSDLVGVLASLAAVPLQNIRLDEARQVAVVHRGYGWSRPVKPVGGPQAMTDALVKRLHALGGELWLETDCSDVEKQADGTFHATTSRGDVTARQVVSSEPRWSGYPAGAPRGLSHGQILLAVKTDLAFPRGVHTLYHVPAGVRRWMNDLADGRPPRHFGFNLVRSLLPKREGHSTLVGFFALPQGEEEFSETRRQAIEDYYLEQAERLLPGLNQAILYKRVLSPADFWRHHGLSSRPVPMLPPAGVTRLRNLNPETGIHHVGISVYPPGNDANAAVLSGAHTAELVHRAMAA